MGVQLQCKKVCILANCALLSSIFILSLRLMVFLLPLTEVQCPKLLDFRNPWGKVMERKGSDLKTFSHKGLKTAAAKKLVFLANLALLAVFFCIGAIIRIGQEIFCLLYAGFLFLFLLETFFFK